MALHLKSTGIDFADFADHDQMSSELLDDYEEGTWTPITSFQNGTSETSKTFTAQNGYYVKVGQHVTGSAVITGEWSGGNADNVNINMPFTRSNATGSTAIAFGVATGSAPSALIQSGAGASNGYFNDGEGTGNFTQFLQQHSAYNIHMTMVYRTT